MKTKRNKRMLIVHLVFVSIWFIYAAIALATYIQIYGNKLDGIAITKSIAISLYASIATIIILYELIKNRKCVNKA